MAAVSDAIDEAEENTAKEEGADPDTDLLPEERCCCGALQRLASPYIFGALTCVINFFQSAASTGSRGGVLSTIEKRFQLRSSQLAPFLIVNNIVSVIMVLFVAYYGHTSHRPRIIGGGSLILGLGLLLCTLPQFIYETPPQFSVHTGRDDNTTTDETNLYPVCTAINATASACTEDEDSSSGPLMRQVALIIVGQIMVGLGTAPILPLSITYMDDALDRSSTSVYVACLFIATSLGTLLGFGLSGFSLSVHADFYKGTVDAQSSDPNWLGAWWLPYAITGSLAIILGLPVVTFPEKIRRPTKSEDRGGKLEETTGDAGEGTSGKEGDNGERNVAEIYRMRLHKPGQGKLDFIKGFLRAIRRLVTNVTFMLMVLGVCALLSRTYGMLVFMAKYLQTQFNLSPSTAPLVFGLIIAPGSLFGNLISGLVVKRLKLTKKGMARMVVIVKPFFYIIAHLILFLGCDNQKIAGVTTNYATMNITDLRNLTAECNSHCACSPDYSPICGSDGMMYATPCHAGCQGTGQGKLVKTDENTTIYTDCTCIGASSPASQLGLIGDYEHVAIQGECHHDCTSLIPFIAAATVGALLTTLIANPAFMLQLRLVDDDDRSVAIGFTSMAVRLLGFIPSPIFFGAAIESACLLLQSSCGKTGNCLVYDTLRFRFIFNGLIVGLDVLAFAMFITCYFSIKETEPESEDLESANRADAIQLSDHHTNSG